VLKTLDGTVTEKYLWQNKTTLLATYDANDNLLQRFEYALGHTPTAFTQGPNRFYIVTDQIGTPRIITDDTGTVVKQIDYDAYGNVIADTNPAMDIPFGFAGGLKDNHTGLTRFGYRDFDPETGRWTARDPIGFAGGDTNLYGYVGGSPVQFIDPEGESKKLAEILFVALEWLYSGDGHRKTGPKPEEITKIEELKPKPSDPDNKNKGKDKNNMFIDPILFPVMMLCATGRTEPGVCEHLGFDYLDLSCPKGFVQDGSSCVAEMC